MNLVTGMGWNTGRAITNIVLISSLGTPVLRVLRRTAGRAAFD
jgi:energy-coupling factor transport system substrate-specific component